MEILYVVILAKLVNCGIFFPRETFSSELLFELMF